MKKDWNYTVDRVKQEFGNVVYSCDGQPCLKFGTYERLGNIIDFLRDKFNAEVENVFHMCTQD